MADFEASTSLRAFQLDPQALEKQETKAIQELGSPGHLD